jgi:KUP system potassium uptake protein
MELNRPPKADFLNLENDSYKKFTFSLSFLGLSLRSLGVIYGDIGTSPLYVMDTIFTSPPASQDVIGAVSLVIWSLLILVTFKYVIFILQANNGGEGGTFALGSLLVSKDSDLSPRWKAVAIIISLFGAALVIGDGALTPAVSVLSAIEGLGVADPNDFTPGSAYTQLIAIIIIVLLFLFQVIDCASFHLP